MDREGEPLIDGGELPELAAFTAIEKTGSEALAFPSLTVILILE